PPRSTIAHSLYFFFQRSSDPRNTHSFPTRRSSDLKHLKAHAQALSIGLHEYEWDRSLMLQRTPAILEGLLKIVIENTAITIHSSDRKSTRLNSSHVSISYAVFCLKKKKQQ